MLIFISDLHFVDGSARAFEYFFQDVAASIKKETKEIKIVSLGDIFDLLHTEMWFAFPVEERPWGKKEREIETHAII